MFSFSWRLALPHRVEAFLKLRIEVIDQTLACVAWRFCRAGRRSGVASGEATRKVSHEKGFLAVSLPSPTFIT